MSHLSITPDPPSLGLPFTICFHWDPVIPGQSVDVEIEYTPEGGSITATFVCPYYGGMACKTFDPPEKAKALTCHPTQGEAPDLSRPFV